MALVLDAFGNAIARGESGVVIASQSGNRLPALRAEQNKALATPADELLALTICQRLPQANHSGKLQRA